MEGRYPPAIMITLSDCGDPTKEAEYNCWFNEIHIPNMESLGFIKNVRRFENVLREDEVGGKPKYLALYEVYHDDPTKALCEIRQLEAELKAQRKTFDGASNSVNTLYRRIGPEIKTERTGRRLTGVHIVLCFCKIPEREDEFNNWYNELHAAEALSEGFQDTAYRYAVVDAADPQPGQSPYLTVYDESMDPREARDGLVQLRPKWNLNPLWGTLLGLNVTGGFRLIYPVRAI